MSTHQEQPLPAGFVHAAYVVVTCRTCQYTLGDEEDGEAIHFTDPDEAADTAAARGWWITSDGALCAACAACQRCATTLGHAWSAWRRCACRGALHDTQQMEFRDCALCQQTQERPAQPSSTASAR